MNRKTTGSLLALSFGVVVAVALSCVKADSVAAPGETPALGKSVVLVGEQVPESSEPRSTENTSEQFEGTNTDAGNSTARDVSDIQAEEIAAIARTQWVGTIHNMAMNDLMANERYWLGNSPTRASECVGIGRLARKYSPSLEKAAGIDLSDDAREKAVLRAVQNLDNCKTLRELSIASRGKITAAVIQDPDLVSAAVFPYRDAMYNAALATDGTPSAVQAAMFGPLRDATKAGLSPADIEYLSGVFNLGSSSSQEWTAVDEAGGLVGAHEPYSLSRRRLVGPFVVRLVGSDLFGCLVGLVAGGSRRWQDALYDCAMGGISASGFFHLSIVK